MSKHQKSSAQGGSPQDGGQGHNDVKESTKGPADSQSKAKQASPSSTSKPTSRSSLRIPNELLVLGSIVSLCIAFLCYYVQEESPDKRFFREDQLALFTGKLNSPLYLAILGEVYDVTKGKDMYGKDGYSFFLGKDATRAFVTGDFKHDLHDDIQGLTEEQCAALVRWRAYYREHKEYPYKGRLLGRFWNMHGKKRPALLKVEQLAEAAKQKEAAASGQDDGLVACNMRWNEATGGAVWCNNGWHPRALVEHNSGDDTGGVTQRCVCFESIGWSDTRRVYPNCKPEASQCQTEPPGPRNQQQEL